MRWRQFFLWLCLGWVLSWLLACSPDSTKIDASQTSAIAPPTSPTTASTPTPVSLPPETEAIVASAGPQGLYNPPRGDIRLVVMSDLNGVYGSTDYDPEVDRAIQLLPFWQPDMVVCSGDMVAGQDISLTLEQIQAMWMGFDQHIAAPLRQANLPYGFTLGNHDASSAMGVNDQFLFQQERDLASEYWLAPEHDPGVEFVDRYEFPFYYTFKYKDAFFLTWDGSSNHIPAEKLAWVEQALSSPAAQQARIRILLGHLPLYAVSVGRNEPGEVMENADQLRSMLEQYNVHTYISGHHHSYYPAHRGKLQLLHMGILGSGPRPLVDSDLPPWKALTVIDIAFASPELTTYTTYDMQTLQLIEYEQLPRFIAGHNGILLRRDVAWEELTPDEKAFCEQRLDRAKCSV
jgi:3',5'-cyclic AMP phosphodiesterase CpdA